MKQAEFQKQPTEGLPVAKKMTPEQEIAVREWMAKVGDELVANLNRNVLKEQADAERESLPRLQRMLNWLRALRRR